MVPSTKHDLRIVPSFLLTVKGSNGSPTVASCQASYDGALGARGMYSLRYYGQGHPDFDNHAYALTPTYLNVDTFREGVPRYRNDRE